MLVLFANNLVIGQSLLESRQTSYYTYVYKITDKEARKVYKNDHFVIDDSYFHTVVDSFPTGSEYNGRLQPGHYIQAYAEGNSLNVKIAYIPDFDVKILNNNTDLCIQVFDLKGNLITDANVKIGNKRIRFDKKSGTYRLAKSNRQGLLQVKYNGQTGYYLINRQLNSSCYNRNIAPILYSFPVRIVWRPVVYFVRLPFDGVISIVKGTPYGTIYRTKWYLQRKYNQIKHFDYFYFFDDYIDRFYDYAERKNLFGINDDYYKGYIVFNKPKYKPGETVKLKAFIINRKGRPLNDELILEIQADRKWKELARIYPYTKGGYEYEFVLHDSLNLKSDKKYQIRFSKHGLGIFSDYIYYEDYELSKLELNIKPDKVNHYKGQENKMLITGKDVNGLNILDGRLECFVYVNKVNDLFDERVFIPDTLLFAEMLLDPTKETELIISDSIFPNANLDYTVLITLLTSDNEKIVEEKRITYYHSKEEIELTLLNDSISINYLKNGLRAEKEVSVFAYDNFKNEIFVGDFTTPTSVLYNSFYVEYVVKSDSVVSGLNIANQSSLLKVNAERTFNRLNINVDNPRNIEFTYNVFKRNKEIHRGYGSKLELSDKASIKHDYFLSIRYIWGGKVKEENYRVRYNDKKLNIRINEPGLIFPGQNAKIDVLVTDHKGNPVEDVDLTAYSITSKFDYNPPTVPNLNKERKNRVVFNNFNFGNNLSSKIEALKLDYEKWNDLLGLDSIEYFKFIFPSDGLYVNSTPSFDSITQFSPYVFINGEIEPIQVIYVDNVPVYFSWSTNIQPYSFRIFPGYRKIKLRTSKHIITIDHIYFKKGEKTIISVDAEKPSNRFDIQKAKPVLSKSERNILGRYVFPYKYNFGDRYAYLKTGNNLFFLEPEFKTWRTNQEIQFSGPVSGFVELVSIGDYSHNFSHEPYYTYEFGRNFLKLISADRKKYPMHFNYSKLVSNINEYVLTEEKIYELWRKSLESKRYTSTRITYPQKTDKGYGSLHFDVAEYSDSAHNYPVNSILLSYDDHKFIRVYPGNYRVMHQLNEGKYVLVLVFSNSKYFIIEDILIRKNGKSFIKHHNPELVNHERFVSRINEILDKLIIDDYLRRYPEGALSSIQNIYRQEFSYYGPGGTVSGYVFDEADGTAIPGATIVIKGTTFGTITDINGFYSLNIPVGNNILIFSFVGYKTEEVDIGYRNRIDVNMSSDIVGLEEIVVVGYGSQARHALSGVVSVVSHDYDHVFSGAPGVSAQEAFSGIRIRGASSIDSENPPLIIVDGIVYAGNFEALDPSFINSITILKSAEATALYGSRAAGGAIIIISGGGEFLDASIQSSTDVELDEMFLEAATGAKSIRDNFSDYAFWQPKLTTNKDGLASFEVTFPDDITSWQTHYLAMNGKKQSGSYSGRIRSYKPLMAQLSLPRFLIQSDTAFAIGKVVNYMSDSISVKTNFSIDGEKIIDVSRYCHTSIIDSLMITGINDSLELKYLIEAANGYIDGEIRNIEIYPLGLEETTGEFFILSKDTVVEMSFAENIGNAKIYAKADVLKLLDVELTKLVNYRHMCNEQVASRLKALLMQKKIKKHKDEKFELDSEVDKAIERLLRTINDDNLWGWWKDSNTSYWISLHVIEALVDAEKEGYKVRLDKEILAENLMWLFKRENYVYTKLRILYTIRKLDPKANTYNFAKELKDNYELSFNHMLQTMELMQQNDKTLNIDTIFKYQKSTIFGNVFFADRGSEFNLLDNEIQNTLIVYRLLKNSDSDYEELLSKIRNFFFETRRSGSWRNTYESALIVETILPDLIKSGPVEKPKLVFKGDINMTVEEFPFEIEVKPASKLIIEKTGTYPVYFTGYQYYWNPEPEVKSNDFEIITYFSETTDGKLTAGKHVKLVAKVKVKKDAEYVMISIPIPAGCSYGEKPNRFRFEAHREYFRHETVIYSEKLRAGEYTFEIDLMPRYTGNYVLNPAKVELMYFPLFNANNELKRIEIK